MSRHRMMYALTVVGLSLGALLPASGTVSAEPPSNDDADGATLLDPAPSQIVQDTTEATTSGDELAFNEFCGAPALEQGVWFIATATTEDVFVVDVTASDYSAGILVLAGEPGNFEPLLCGPGMVSGPVFPGQTIYLLVFGDGLGPTSGNLVLDIYAAPPPPEVSVTIDARGTADKAGLAYISGTVTCTSEDPSAVLFDVSGSMRQRVGRFFIDGFFFSDQFTPCDGVTRSWTAEVSGNGRFSGGKADVSVFAFACGGFSCADGSAEATIHLRRNAK